MSLSLTFENRGKYLLATVSGEIELQEAKDCVYRIIEYCRDNLLRKALIDARGVTGELTANERIAYGAHLAATDWELTHDSPIRPLQLAFVVLPPVVDPFKLGQQVAQSRGSFTRTVSDIDEARRWLDLKPEPDRIKR